MLKLPNFVKFSEASDPVVSVAPSLKRIRPSVVLGLGLGLCLGLMSGSTSVAAASDAGASQLVTAPVTAPVDDAALNDQRFLALRDAAAKEDGTRAQDLANQLATYPLASYVDYYRIRANLRNPAGVNVNDVQHFFSLYDGSAIADRLRNDWLLLLGRKNDWATFDTQYAQFVLKDDAQVTCYAMLSKLQQGGNVADEARRFLTSAKPYGEGCYPLVTNLVRSGQFSRADMWNQVRWSAETRSGTVAAQLSSLFSLDKVAKALDNPVKFLTKPMGNSTESHEAALIALGLVAKTDPDKAVGFLNRISPGLSRNERAVAWTQIALPAAQKLQPEALSYWTKAGSLLGDSVAEMPLSLDGYEWRVRSALRGGDWTMVKNGIEAMPDALRNEPTWVYWLGRAYLNLGQREAGNALFQSIAGQTHFYGQLAMEELGQKISIPLATPVRDADLNKLSTNTGFQRANQFYAMNPT